MIVQALPLFTTVAQKFNQGLIRIRVIYPCPTGQAGNSGSFLFLFGQAKRKEETSC
jgi:hypothetical protein